jgi:PEGA domain
MPEQDPLQSEIDAASKKGSFAVPAVLGLVVVVSFLAYAMTWGQSASNNDPLPDWVKPPPPLKMSQVQIFSQPEGANVYLEDSLTSLAKTPGVVTVTAGPHTFRIELPGLAVKKVTLDTSKENQVEVSWSAIAVDLASTPEEGVALYLDGKPLGYAPFRLYFPKDGKLHEVKAQLPLYPEQVHTFTATQYLSHRFDFLAPSSTSTPTTLP